MRLFRFPFGPLLPAVGAATATSAGLADSPLFTRVQAHFDDEPRTLPIVAQTFEEHEHPNVHLALDELVTADGVDCRVYGVKPQGFRFNEMSLSELVLPPGKQEGPHTIAPIEYKNFVLKDDRVIACIVRALFLLERGTSKLAVFVCLVQSPGEKAVKVEVMADDRPAAEKFLAEVRSAMRKRSVYRGRVISISEAGWNATRINFHTLPKVERQQIIFPQGVLERVEAQTIGFSKKSQTLRAAGRHLKRGVLLHGPPGTGKTLTAMYLATSMPDRTTLLLTGRGLGRVTRTCELARMLEPSIVILEDVDLIAEERTQGGRGCATPLLFELLNEMDGLSDDVDVIFLLTTNRPDLLEPALASRPGRIDLAVEVPLPDEEGRRRLFALYSAGLTLNVSDLERYIKRTEGASPAFIRELFRKAVLFAADDGPEIVITDRLLDESLSELVFRGGDLTKRLLGFQPKLGFHAGD